MVTEKVHYQAYLPPLKARELILYEGAFSHDVVVQFTKELANVMGGEKPKKLFVTTIELIQNIKNYSAETLDLEGYPSVGVGIAAVYDGGDMFITMSGNLVKNIDVPRIERHCMKVRGKTSQELRSMYNEQLKSTPPEGSKGAGLGFFDIALKTSGQVDFEFTHFNDEYTFFSITAFITKL